MVVVAAAAGRYRNDTKVYPAGAGFVCCRFETPTQHGRRGPEKNTAPRRHFRDVLGYCFGRYGAQTEAISPQDCAVRGEKQCRAWGARWGGGCSPLLVFGQAVDRLSLWTGGSFPVGGGGGLAARTVSVLRGGARFCGGSHTVHRRTDLACIIAPRGATQPRGGRRKSRPTPKAA